MTLLGIRALLDRCDKLHIIVSDSIFDGYISIYLPGKEGEILVDIKDGNSIGKYIDAFEAGMNYQKGLTK